MSVVLIKKLVSKVCRNEMNLLECKVIELDRQSRRRYEILPKDKIEFSSKENHNQVSQKIQLVQWKYKGVGKFSIKAWGVEFSNPRDAGGNAFIMFALIFVYLSASVASLEQTKNDKDLKFSAHSLRRDII